ncbi:MAG: formylglycine-generating enzyme family protein [Bacteroidales bacterium]|jgi:formylglycine-generating enzyme required for sulfatase activity|nr:formylglycine-generating enzyme family protein [Bacteroidales bacterium]
MKKSIFLAFMLLALTTTHGQVETFSVDGILFNMIPVQGGTFTIGCTKEQSDECWDIEKPEHKVIITGYYLAETEVTQELWEAVMGNNPSTFKGSKRPVENISWDDAQEFIKRLNKKTGRKFRLPTEAEWEFAARGGNLTKRNKYCGSNNLDDVAWYDENAEAQTHEVKTKQPNELGFYDMSGNVWEWCNDWFTVYTVHSETNPQGVPKGFRRILRGGCWNSYSSFCRVSHRDSYIPSANDYGSGLRLALPK